MNYRVISDFKLIDINKWSDFVKNHNNGSIFQTYEMYMVYKSTKNYEPVIIICVDEKNEIAGSILSVIQREYKGILGMFSSRSIIWGAPLVKNNNVEVLNLLLSEYDNIIKNKAVYTQIRNLWNTDEFKEIFEKYGYIYEEHLNILVDLTKSEETLWKKVFPKRRNQVLKAQKQGVSIEIVNDEILFEQSYNILREIYKRAKLPLPGKEYFKLAFNTFSEKGYLKCFGAFYDNMLIGIMLVFYFNKRAYEWYIGCYPDFMKYNPNDLIIWEAFKWSKQNGSDIYDFGGAGKPGVEYGVREYKKKFGGAIVNLGRYQKVHKSILMKISVIGFKFWQILKF
jgi:serine/alanine adding enzyme